jgi:hypothetical protein
MNMQNQFKKMSVFECQIISENIHKLKQEEFKDFQVLLYKFQDIQGLEFLFSNLRTFKNFQVLYEPCLTIQSENGSSFICKEGCRFSMGWCMREPYCPLSSAVGNATIPTLVKMVKSACSLFCYVLHYLLFKKFTSTFYHVCVTGQLL